MGASRRFAVAGAPILHSRSPGLHHAVFESLGLPWRYTRVHAAGPDTVLALLREIPFAGLNLTAPLKESCLGLADEVETPARAIGAVNTLVVGEGGRVSGANTDAEGVLGALDGTGVPLDGRPALVLGAGGAARAAVVALQSRGCPVTVTNRTPERATSLAADLGCAVMPWSGLEAAVRAAPIVVSTVPASGSDDVRAAWLSAGHVVLDADYASGRLAARARSAGCRVADGLDWLALQAVGAARRFTGRDVPVGVLRAALGALPEPLPRRLALVGFMGAGKSTVARRVADALGWDLVETDALVEAHFGRPAARVFAEDGEAAFRAAEARVLDRLADRERVVLSCGGGLPAHGRNAQVLQERFTAFWLHVSLDAARARVGDDPARPLWSGRSRDDLADLYERRKDAYLACSRVVVETDGRTAEAVAEDIVDDVRSTF